jgi:peptidoglycan/xylan/chitin deacetylase (PgdA/CDA1 family)
MFTSNVRSGDRLGARSRPAAETAMQYRAVRASVVALVLALGIASASSAEARTIPRLTGALSELEGRILQAADAAGLTERLVGIAADTNGHLTVVGLWFLRGDPVAGSLPALQPYAWKLVQTTFAAAAAVDEVDVTGVQPGNGPLEINHMEVVFSAAISRDEFLKAAMFSRAWSPRASPESDPVAAPVERQQPPDVRARGHRMRGEIYHGDLSHRAMAITFDDGPFPIYTTLLLDTLGRLGVKATFFLVGQQVQYYPYFAQAIQGAGHEVANHTFHHTNLTRLSAPQVFEEIARAQDTIAAVTGQVPRYFRPPGGNYDATVLHTAHELGLVTVFWTANSADYTNLEPQALETRVLAHVSSGGIMLFHQGMENTLRILPHITEILRSRGYVITTVGNLVASEVGPPLRSR